MLQVQLQYRRFVLLPFEDQICPATPTGFDFYFDSYTGYRRPLWRWRHQCGWMRIIRASAGFPLAPINKTIFLVTDEYGDAAPDYLGAALTQMATSLPYAPYEPEPEEAFEILEEMAAAIFCIQVERHFITAFDALEAQHAKARDRLERSIDALANELHRALRAVGAAMRDSSLAPKRLARLEHRRRKLEWAQQALSSAFRLGLKAQRRQAEREEAALTHTMDKPPDLSPPISIYWRLI